MRRSVGALAMGLVSLLSATARAEPADRVKTPALSQPPTHSIAVVAHQARRQTRDVHPDYTAFSAGALLFGLGYAIAVASPLRSGFSGSSGRLAIPIAGPWLSNVSWGWALDGLMQLGGVAFMIDAYANPVTILGTPQAWRLSPRAGEHLVALTILL